MMGICPGSAPAGKPRSFTSPAERSKSAVTILSTANNTGEYRFRKLRCFMYRFRARCGTVTLLAQLNIRQSTIDERCVAQIGTHTGCCRQESYLRFAPTV